MRIKDLCKKAHKAAVDKGFWSKKSPEGYWSTRITRNISELLMLVVSELGEACEALRKGRRQDYKPVRLNVQLSKPNDTWKVFMRKVWLKDTFEDELADAVIRICDLAESEGIDLEWQIKEKMKYNETRPMKHGKNF